MKILPLFFIFLGIPLTFNILVLFSVVIGP